MERHRGPLQKDSKPGLDSCQLKAGRVFGRTRDASNEGRGKAQPEGAQRGSHKAAGRKVAHPKTASN